jgi:NAD(P)-dependent dehydrogenase (short-subunit alcohol dehydrogenase family)
MTRRFSGKLVLVAGGTGGLGRAVTLAFLEEGAKVVVTYRRQTEMDALNSAAGIHTASLAGRIVDVTDEAAVSRLVQEAIAESGHLDVLVNTIGAYAGGATLWEANPAEFDRMLKLNLLSGYALMRAVVPAMLKQGSGTIVNVASRAAVDHSGAAAGYVASKAAAVAMLDSLAADLKGTGVRANSVLPSIIDTAANRQAMPEADFAKWPKPEDIARIILFLASDDARLIHGAAVPVYGAT